MMNTFKLLWRVLAQASIMGLLLLTMPWACGTAESPGEPTVPPSAGNTGLRATEGPEVPTAAAPRDSSPRDHSTVVPAERNERGATAAGPSNAASGQSTPPGAAPTEVASAAAGPGTASDAPPPVPTRTTPPVQVTWVLEEGFPLNQAAFEGTRQDVETLLDQGEHIGTWAELRSSVGETMNLTPLELAVWNNGPEVVELLLEPAASGHLGRDRRLIQIAVRYNPDPEVMKLLLDVSREEMEFRIKQANLEDKNALRFICDVASLGRHPEPVALILDLGWSKHIGSRCAEPTGRSGSATVELARYSVLHKAAAVNPEAGVIEVLLDYGADPNMPLHHHYHWATPLDHAAQYNPEPKVAAALIDRGADVNGGSGRGSSLEFAVKENPEPAVAAVLIGRGADVNPAGRENSAALLHGAIERDDHAPLLVKMLLDAGMDIEGSSGGLALMYAIHRMDDGMEEVVALLLEKGANVNARDRERRTVLHVALTRGSHAEVVRRLLENGADANAQHPDGRAPLHMRVSNPEVVQLLLDQGADPNAQHPDGRAPLHMASRNSEVVELLLGKGADPNARDQDGRAPLHEAVSNPEVVRMLLDKGADPNARDQDGRAPLHEASGNPEVVRLLLDQGAEVDSRDGVGSTPLLLALGSVSRLGHLDTVKLLLERGADPHAANDRGRTPCLRAPYSPYSAIAECMESVCR